MKYAGKFVVAALALAGSSAVWAEGKTEDAVRAGTPGQDALSVPQANTAAGSYLITFDEGPSVISTGATLSTQYAAWGVEFSAPAYVGAGWATNTDMTVVAVGGGDTGVLGTPSLVSGNILRSFDGWFNEDADASFVMIFSAPISSVSVDFAGVNSAYASLTAIDIYDTNANFITSVTASAGGQLTLSYSGSNIGFVGVTPGSFDDWVGVDNIRFTVAAAVPEPTTYGMMALGLAVLGVAARRRRQG